jgi:hypothetical protein
VGGASCPAPFGGVGDLVQCRFVEFEEELTDVLPPFQKTRPLHFAWSRFIHAEQGVGFIQGCQARCDGVVHAAVNLHDREVGFGLAEVHVLDDEGFCLRGEDAQSSCLS